MCNSTPDLYLFTDASQSGWGAHLEPLGLTAQGTWDINESCIHINNLELKTVYLVLIQFNNCCNRQNCTACYRQHDCSVLHSKTGGGHIPYHCFGKPGSFKLVSVNVNSTTNQTCSRQAQCFNRRVVPSEQDFTCGIDTETKDSYIRFSIVRNSDSRSVHNQTKSSYATVCVANSRPSSLSSRCTISGLPIVRLHVFTVQSDSCSIRKDSTVTPVQNYSNSALLATEIMVQPASELPCGLTDSPSSTGRSVISVSGSSSTHEPRDTTPSRLDVIKQSIRENNFSEKVASRIAQSRRISTHNVRHVESIIRLM